MFDFGNRGTTAPNTLMVLAKVTAIIYTSIGLIITCWNIWIPVTICRYDLEKTYVNDEFLNGACQPFTLNQYQSLEYHIQFKLGISNIPFPGISASRNCSKQGENNVDHCEISDRRSLSYYNYFPFLLLLYVVLIQIPVSLLTLIRPDYDTILTRVFEIYVDGRGAYEDRMDLISEIKIKMRIFKVREILSLVGEWLVIVSWILIGVYLDWIFFGNFFTYGKNYILEILYPLEYRNIQWVVFPRRSNCILSHGNEENMTTVFPTCVTSMADLYGKTFFFLWTWNLGLLIIATIAASISLLLTFRWIRTKSFVFLNYKDTILEFYAERLSYTEYALFRDILRAINPLTVNRVMRDYYERDLPMENMEMNPFKRELNGLVEENMIGGFMDNMQNEYQEEVDMDIDMDMDLRLKSGSNRSLVN